MLGFQILKTDKITVDDDLFDGTGYSEKVSATIKWREVEITETITVRGEQFSEVVESVKAHVVKSMSFYPEIIFERIDLPDELRFVSICEEDFSMGIKSDITKISNEEAHDPGLNPIIWSTLKKLPYPLIEALYIERIKLSKAHVFVGTAFTFNMVEDLSTINVEANPITWEEMDAVLFAMKKQHSEFVETINGMGHESTSQMLGEHSYRRSLSLKKGDILYIPQYRGPRLPEGETKLPEGALLVPIKVIIK